MDYITIIDNIYNTTETHNIRTSLADKLTSSKKEKKDNMEIHTPCVLVDDMLRSIPLEFWTKPHKVLEPCCGKGNFIIAIFDLFFNGLEICIPNIKLRCEKIINYCIYYTDISPYNILITTEILKRHVLSKNVTITGYNNGHTGDTLSCKINDIFGVDKFDAIVCNPPYQSGKGSNGTLWDKFVIYALGILKTSGYMLFIHPSGWRNISGKFKKLQKLLLSKNMLYLEIHGEKDGMRMFRCSTRYDWYLLQNDEVETMDTIVRFSDNTIIKIDLKKEEFIPNSQYHMVKSLLALPHEETVDIMYSYKSLTKSSITQDGVFTLPIIYTISSKNVFRYLYIKEKDNLNTPELNAMYGTPKLIWTNGSIKTVCSYIDYTGEYGLSCYAYAIVDDIDNLLSIQKVFDSVKFRELMDCCAVGQRHISNRVIRGFRKNFWINFLDKP